VSIVGIAIAPQCTQADEPAVVGADRQQAPFAACQVAAELAEIGARFCIADESAKADDGRYRARGAQQCDDLRAERVVDRDRPCIVDAPRREAQVLNVVLRNAGGHDAVQRYVLRCSSIAHCSSPTGNSTSASGTRRVAGLSPVMTASSPAIAPCRPCLRSH